jgi:hypothetical protein
LQPVALLGEAQPRVLVAPRGARANSWEDVADLSARAGVVLDGWQELILEAAMGERSNATWAAKRVGVSVPRQNGKSQLLVSRALAGVLLFGEKKIVISAHQQDTARETFSKMIEILEADGNGWLMDRVRPNGIMNAINREAIRFKNGATVQFKARSGSGGRGFSSDCLMLDEAQRLKRPAWVSINSTMSAMPNPQVWLLGTPPTREDREAQMGEVFESVRSSATDGSSTSSAWCEWGVDPEDPAFVAMMKSSSRAWSPTVERLCWSSNPAWNARMNLDVVQGEFESYTPEEFAQDRLGAWLTDLNAGSRLISAAAWSGRAVEAAPEGVRSFGVAFSYDGSRQSVAGAVRHDAGVHVELIGAQSGSTDSGIAALADWFTAPGPDGRERWRMAATIVISGRSHATVLHDALRARGVPANVLHVASTAEYMTSGAMFLDGVQDETLTYPKPADPALDALTLSVAVSDKKARGTDGAWGWNATTPDGDETPVEAASLALWGAKTSKRRPGRKAVVSY